MKRSRISNLFFIAPLDNLPSILKSGILCRKAVRGRRIANISDPVIQDIRAKKKIPGTNKLLHEYANLYFNPRNPMMFKRKEMHESLCVIAISTGILNLSGVIITDGNAASKWSSFYAAKSGFDNLNEAMIFTADWTDVDEITYWRQKRCVCAEILIPEKVPPSFFEKIYVSCKGTKKKVVDLLGNRPLSKHVVIDADMFFQEEES